MDTMLGAAPPGAGATRLTERSGTGPREEDVRLVEAAREGDRDAFEVLYERYAGLVHAILLARMPRAEVEDVVQDVFLRVCRRMGSLRDAASFGPWIAMIARNRAADYHRRAFHHPTEPLSEDLASREPDAADGALVDGAAALAAIRALPDAYRETLALRFVEGMTGPEIARKTGMTHGSVRVNLHRGMALLRERLRSAPHG